MLVALDTFAAAVAVSRIVMKGLSDRVQADINAPLLRPDALCDSAQTIPRRFSNICLWVFYWLTGESKRSLFSTECGLGD